MKYRRYTEAEVVERTRETIRFFMNKQMEPFLAALDKNFVWIGDYTSLFTRGVPAFLRSVWEESREPPVEILEEEYALLSHERTLWVTYGRFAARFMAESGAAMMTRVHFSFVWRQTKGELRLLQAVATHTKDGTEETATRTQARIFDELPFPHGAEGADARKLEVRSMDRSTRYLFASEILYMQSHNKYCEIFTKTGSFFCRATLKSLEQPPFLLIHQSYLINTEYIDRVYRYRAVLRGGQELPIGKERYMDLKKRLKG